MKDELMTGNRYGLTSMQQGMLLENLYAPDSGTNIEQIVCRLREDLDVTRIKEAWSRVVECHGALRTSFHALERGKPYQEVHANVDVRVDVIDWRELSPAERDRRLVEFLAADRKRGFRWDVAPIQRVTLFQCGCRENIMVWTFHHALLDGRSFVIVLEELFGVYDCLVQGSPIELPRERPFREHVDWVQRIEHKRAEPHWRKLLLGFAPPTPLGLRNADAGAPPGRGIESIRLSAEATSMLRRMASGQQVTLNTFVQCAWALLLSRYSQENDIVFGTVRACRKSGIPDADRMVGLFINTVPVRVRVNEEQPVSALLKLLRAQHVDVREYEHTPLGIVQQWVDASRGAPLFQSILVFENFRLENQLRRLGDRWSQRSFQLHEQPGFPLTLYGYAEDELYLELAYERQLFDRNAVIRALEHMEALLVGMAAHIERPVGELSMLTETERRRMLGEWNQTQTRVPLDKCIHRAFEEQVGTKPGAAIRVTRKYTTKLWMLIVNSAAYCLEKDLFSFHAPICC